MTGPRIYRIERIMEKTFLDECFKARMDNLRDRFPIEDFRRCFKDQYRQNGMVMIQPTTNSTMAAVMIADEQHGFIFRTQHDLDVALRLLRLWGFNVTTRRETDLHREYTAYIVQLPDDYLTHHVGSNKAGIIRTGLRSISNVDRTKRQKPFDWTV